MPSLKWSRGVEKVGVLGFCMGGALSAAAAVLVAEIDASVVFYGTPQPELARMAGNFPCAPAGGAMIYRKADDQVPACMC